MSQRREQALRAQPSLEWFIGNQRYLMAAVAVVRGQLARHIGLDDTPDDAALRTLETAVEVAKAQLSAPPALDIVCALFSLSSFQRGILLLCAALELDSAFAGLFAAAHGDSRKTYPTFGLALAALPDAHWSAITPISALRHWLMVELGTALAITHAPLRLDERILHYLTGISYLDPRFDGIIVPVGKPSGLAHGLKQVIEAVRRVWLDHDGALARIVLVGAEADVRAVAAAVCESMELAVYWVNASVLPVNASELQTLARLWEREAALQGAALVVYCDMPDAQTRASAFINAVESAVLVAGQNTVPQVNMLTRSGAARLMHRFEVPHATAAEQRRLWSTALGDALKDHHAFPRETALDTLVNAFDLDAERISGIGMSVRAQINGSGSELLPRLWQIARQTARPKLDDLAQRINARASWEDLILPESHYATLTEIVAHARTRYKVYERWGFADKETRGMGISVLFSGASGTGKTMAAEVLANTLALDLYRIDLSAVVSKYIGETEKNLRAIFDAAESGGVILLFDEADALFGKRSDVKDSHDRYANIEVSYLLQRMEAYRGVAILTTNMKSSLDNAFMRRLRFVIEFPFPDHGARLALWQRAFPAQTPTEALDFNRLAQLNLSGGHIRNIALNAAFLAADMDQPVMMAHIRRAAQSEYGKLERALTDGELRGW